MQTVNDLIEQLMKLDLNAEIVPPKDGMIYKFSQVNNKPYVYLVPAREGK